MERVKARLNAKKNVKKYKMKTKKAFQKRFRVVSNTNFKGGVTQKLSIHAQSCGKKPSYAQ